MAERRAGTKSRRLGSSRRRQLREGAAEAPVAKPGPGEDPLWASQAVQRVQDFLREQDKDQRGFVTRSDLQKLQEEDLPCSTEELQLVFDGLDAAGTGRIGTEEFTARLPARDHHWQQSAASQRVPSGPPSPALEGVGSEEQRHFAAFMDQLGMDSASEVLPTGHPRPCRQEMWQLWVKLRQDEPQLLGSLEDFLAAMRNRIQEAKSKKEALEVTLNKHVAEHDQKVQQLCETLERQMEQERQRLEQESAARSQQRRMELQRALDASEREVQSLVTAQRELEARCHRLRSTQRAASAENQQLEETNRVLEDHLQHLQQQLQQTHRNLQATRAAVAWEHVEEPGDRAVPELPSEMPTSPQMSLEKQRSRMRLRLGSRSSKPKAKSIHQVVWEVLPAEKSLSGASPGASSVEQEPFPELLKEEGFSDQNSLLREMNDAIAALSEHLKAQALGAPSAPTDSAQHPPDDAEPPRGPEAAAAPGTAPEVLGETVPSTFGHELLEGDLREGPVAAELPAPEGPEAGGSMGAGHYGAQQGESPEEAWKLLSLQGKAPGVKELRLQVAEQPQGAAGESMEGEQVLVEAGGEGWMQDKTGWEKAQPPGEAEEEAWSQGENLEAGLGPPWAGQAGWQLGEQLVGVEVQTQGEASDGEVPPAPGQHGGISRAEGEEEEVEVTQPREAEPQPRDEPGGGGAAGAGGVEVLGAVPPADVQEGGADVQPLEAQNNDASVQLPAQLEADLQPPRDAGDLGKEQAGSLAPELQPLEKDEAELGLEEEMGTGVGDSEGPSPAGSPVESPDLCGQSLAKAQALKLVEAEDLQADKQLPGGTSPESPQGGVCQAAMQLMEEAEDGAQGQSKPELAHEPGLDLQAAGARQGEGAVTEEQPLEEAEILHTLQHQSTGAEGQLVVERGEPRLTPGESTEPDFHPLSELGSLGMEQERNMAPEAQSLDQVQEPELVGMKAEDAQAEMQLGGDVSLESSQGGGDHGAVQLVEEAEDETQGQSEHEVPHEPVLHPHGEARTEGEGPGAPEGAENLDVLEDQSADAQVQLTAEVEELKSTPGGSTEADLSPLGAAGMQGGDSGLGAAASTEGWEGAAGACVSSLAEATSHPEHLAAPEELGLEAMLGPGGQILEDSQTLGILQGEKAAAEEPLDGAQGLEVVQGERLEAGLRSSVEPQSPGLGQGRGDGVPTVATPGSEGASQISMPKLEAMMQEDVLIPDVQLLGASGQAAPREPREQVSAQADGVRPHTAPQQLEEKPLQVREAEQVAASPAEPPEQEIPPVPALPTRIQQKEDAGNDQLGMVLGSSSLGDTAGSSQQPQRQLSAEQSNDLGVGQRGEKQPEAGQRVSREGEPSPGEPGAGAAEGAAAAPRGRPEAPPDSDHLYNVLFVGDSHVGKTSFLYRLHADTFNPQLAATVGLDYQVKTLVVDNMHFTLRLWDSAGQERYRSVTRQFFRKADGVVLMYDLTSQYSFLDLRYWLSCVQEGAGAGVAVLLLGNKTDCAAERQVPREEGERLAQEHQLMFYECSAASGHNVSESMASLVRLLKDREDELKHQAEEVGRSPQKTKGCCW
ncbi:ras-related protein Rab-44 [Melanerpes formicivorus]|uniref:ras-related protein Rab-44 n=1 Tax=Melanerpes formicivorus TaxID=211600 RepID=UPI003590025D